MAGCNKGFKAVKINAENITLKTVLTSHHSLAQI